MRKERAVFASSPLFHRSFPLFARQGIAFAQKSTIFFQKSWTFFENVPTFGEKSTVFLRNFEMCLRVVRACADKVQDNLLKADIYLVLPAKKYTFAYEGELYTHRVGFPPPLPASGR